MSRNLPLTAAAACSSLVGVLHVVIIALGPKWYRYFGAPSMAAQIEHGVWLLPTVLTLGIAIIFFAWAAYALSGIGFIRRLPLLRTGLIAIGTVFVLRGLLLVPELVGFIQGRLHALRFILFSAFSLFAGISYLLGAMRVWRANSRGI
jgi:hypothetical protein